MNHWNKIQGKEGIRLSSKARRDDPMQPEEEEKGKTLRGRLVIEVSGIGR